MRAVVKAKVVAEVALAARHRQYLALIRTNALH